MRELAAGKIVNAPVDAEFYTESAQMIRDF